jgi:hypothetical protein
MSRKDLKGLVVDTYRNHGDALAGERIIAQARDVGKAYVVPGTSTHKMQELILALRGKKWVRARHHVNLS